MTYDLSRTKCSIAGYNFTLTDHKRRRAIQTEKVTIVETRSSAPITFPAAVIGLVRTPASFVVSLVFNQPEELLQKGRKRDRDLGERVLT